MVSFSYYKSNESSASTHICIAPSRYNFAYTSGSSMASAFHAQSDPGVVVKFFSASQQSCYTVLYNFLGLRCRSSFHYGRFRADRNFILEDGYGDSYLWMTEQMNKRIGEPPKGVVFPVWAWYQWEGKRNSRIRRGSP